MQTFLLIYIELGMVDNYLFTELGMADGRYEVKIAGEMRQIGTYR